MVAFVNLLERPLRPNRVMTMMRSYNVYLWWGHTISTNDEVILCLLMMRSYYVYPCFGPTMSTNDEVIPCLPLLRSYHVSTYVEVVPCLYLCWGRTMERRGQPLEARSRLRAPWTSILRRRRWRRSWGRWWCLWTYRAIEAAAWPASPASASMVVAKNFGVTRRHFRESPAYDNFSF